MAAILSRPQCVNIFVGIRVMLMIPPSALQYRLNKPDYRNRRVFGKAISTLCSQATVMLWEGTRITIKLGQICHRITKMCQICTWITKLCQIWTRITKLCQIWTRITKLWQTWTPPMKMFPHCIHQDMLPLICTMMYPMKNFRKLPQTASALGILQCCTKPSLWAWVCSRMRRGLDNTHYNDVIMSTITSQITSLTIVYSIVYSGADQRKRQSSVSLAFVKEWSVNSPHKWPVTRKMFPFDDVIMVCLRSSLC